MSNFSIKINPGNNTIAEVEIMVSITGSSANHPETLHRTGKILTELATAINRIHKRHDLSVRKAKTP